MRRPHTCPGCRDTCMAVILTRGWTDMLPCMWKQRMLLINKACEITRACIRPINALVLPTKGSQCASNERVRRTTIHANPLRRTGVRTLVETASPDRGGAKVPSTTLAICQAMSKRGGGRSHWVTSSASASTHFSSLSSFQIPCFFSPRALMYVPLPQRFPDDHSPS